MGGGGGGGRGQCGRPFSDPGSPGCHVWALCMSVTPNGVRTGLLNNKSQGDYVWGSKWRSGSTSAW